MSAASVAGKRALARRAVEQACPRCSARREPSQAYCVECGLPLPAVTGAVPSLRRRWLRRVGWYPGDWIWAAIATLGVAAAGAAVSIAVTHHSHATTAGTVVATTARAGARQAAPGTPPAVVVPTRAGTKAAASRPNGKTRWPPVGSGWTVVLASYPSTGGLAAPTAAATRAARAGLAEVGVLDSSRYSSLHPGYYVVFSGIYSAPADAETALRSAHASGFGSAYSRQISR